jgi:hypothetical protein
MMHTIWQATYPIHVIHIVPNTSMQSVSSTRWQSSDPSIDIKSNWKQYEETDGDSFGFQMWTLIMQANNTIIQLPTIIH